MAQEKQYLITKRYADGSQGRDVTTQDKIPDRIQTALQMGATVIIEPL